MSASPDIHLLIFLCKCFSPWVNSPFLCRRDHKGIWVWRSLSRQTSPLPGRERWGVLGEASCCCCSGFHQRHQPELTEPQQIGSLCYLIKVAEFCVLCRATWVSGVCVSLLLWLCCFESHLPKTLQSVWTNTQLICCILDFVVSFIRQYKMKMMIVCGTWQVKGKEECCIRPSSEEFYRLLLLKYTIVCCLWIFSGVTSIIASCYRRSLAETLDYLRAPSLVKYCCDNEWTFPACLSIQKHSCSRQNERKVCGIAGFSSGMDKCFVRPLQDWEPQAERWMGLDHPEPCKKSCLSVCPPETHSTFLWEK